MLNNDSLITKVTKTIFTLVLVSVIFVFINVLIALQPILSFGKLLLSIMCLIIIILYLFFIIYLHIKTK